MDKTLVRRKIPTFSELVETTPEKQKENELLYLLNQEPPKQFVLEHPLKKGVKYLPISRIEEMLVKIFGQYTVTIKSIQIIANSVVTTVTVTVKHPITGEDWSMDGCGGWAIQVDKGAGAADLAHLKSDGVALATPASETEAIKDSCHKFGRIFGGCLNRATESDYDSLLKPQTDESELKQLYEQNKGYLTPEEQKRAETILSTKEANSYLKLKELIISKSK